MVGEEHERSRVELIEASAPMSTLNFGKDEAPPEGIPAAIFDTLDEGPDLATIVAEMSALKQEVKLQARTFKKLQEALQAFVGDAQAGVAPPFLAQLSRALTEAVNAGFQDGVESAAEILDDRRREADAELDDARDAGFLEAAEAIMDARDRLAFGLAQARQMLAEFSGWRARLSGGRDVLTAALQGQELALARLDEALRDKEFVPLASEGSAFDPERMRAVETAAHAGAKTGTVLAILRQGYSKDEQTIRIADVRVATEK